MAVVVPVVQASFVSTKQEDGFGLLKLHPFQAGIGHRHMQRNHPEVVGRRSISSGFQQ